MYDANTKAVTAAHCLPINAKIGFSFTILDFCYVERTVQLLYICKKNDFALMKNLSQHFKCFGHLSLILLCGN